jgi:hypothetical protein
MLPTTVFLPTPRQEWWRWVVGSMPDGTWTKLVSWTALTRYLEDGDIAIDNNHTDRSLRGIAVGRNHWRFFGSDRGGKTMAILRSFVASCELETGSVRVVPRYSLTHLHIFHSAPRSVAAARPGLPTSLLSPFASGVPVFSLWIYSQELLRANSPGDSARVVGADSEGLQPGG